MKYVGHEGSQTEERRTPHGVRGLKYAWWRVGQGEMGVAPLTGCVD